jgi:hypothetical protein
MKKIITFLSVFIILSCSKSDSENPTESTLLLKKVINGDQVSTISYDGFKISEVSFSGGTGKEIYTYDGDLITEIKYVNSSNRVEYKYTYTYENNKLKTFIEDRSSGSNTTKYVYSNNSDGTVGYTKTDITNSALGNIFRGNGVLTFTNGAVTKDEFFNVDYPTNTNVFSLGYIYEHDNKNNIIKNIIGFNKLYGNRKSNFKYNLTKNYQFTKLLNNDVLTTLNDNPETRTYVYNSLNFPTESKFYEVDGSFKGATQYFYE